MITLHGIYRSRASRNLWLLDEMGVGFRHIPVIQAYKLPDPLAPDAPPNTRSPDFLALSPQGAIPVMEDGDLVLSESLAINLYLAQAYGGVLGPKNAAEGALMTQWALYGAATVEPPALAIMFAHAQGRAGTDEGKAEIAAQADILRRPFAVLDEHLARDGLMLGGRFTVADINMAEIVRYAQPEAGLIAEFPALDHWLKACQARPSFQRMWAARDAEPA